MNMHRVVTSLAATLLSCAAAFAQEPAPPPAEPAPAPPAQEPAPPAQEPSPPPRQEPPAKESAWEFSFEAYSFTVPDDHSYVQTTIAADRDQLHLEARYNYEDIDTASVWVGWNFEFGVGDEVALAITPMIGGVFGETSGFAPGCLATVAWWRLELYAEAEYLFDSDDSSDNFFYTWSEFTVSVTDWLRVGCVAQHTQLYDTDLDTQRGLMAGVSVKQFDFTAYMFNPDESEPVYVVSAGVSL
jgi:hypothetical protein